MTKINDFYQLDAWKVNHKLTIEVYKETDTFPQKEIYGLTSQLRRAASSTTANIAEGFGYYHYANKIRFYRQARGSIKEVQNFILLAKDLNYLQKEIAKKLWEEAKRGEKLINGLIRSTEKQKIRKP